MPSYMIRDLPPGLISRAKAVARQLGTTLDAVLAAALTRYADGTDQAGAGRKGGQARADALSPDQRAEIARKAAEARWGKKNG